MVPEKRKKSGITDFIFDKILISKFDVVGALALVVVIITGGYQLYKLATWNRVEAIVRSGGLRTYESEDSKNHTSKTMYRPELMFSYAIEEKKYENLTTASYWSDKETANEILKLYPAGSKKEIFVNPSNPDEINFDLYSLNGFSVPLMGILLSLGCFAFSRMLNYFFPNVPDMPV